MTTSSFKSKHSSAASNDAEADGHISNDVNTSDLNHTMEKTDSEEDTWSSTGYNYINPFVHRLQIDNNIDLAKVSTF